jgi:hypothetical protein
MIAWYRFLGVEGTGRTRESTGVDGHSARKGPLQESIAQLATAPQEKEAKVADPRRDRICKVLQQVLKRQDVGSRSVEQEQAMRAVLDGQNPQIAVLPTGAARVCLFTAPAGIEQSGVAVLAAGR